METETKARIDDSVTPWRYWDKNGDEITEGCWVRFVSDYDSDTPHKVALLENGMLGWDSTNPAWVDNGRAEPGEFGYYPFELGDMEYLEIVKK